MRVLLATFLAAGTALVAALPAMATPGKGQLFHDGAVVGTVVTPAPIAPGSGTDPFYKVTGGAPGQLGIAGVARSRDPAWMERNLPPVFDVLAGIGAPIAHYKVCSTFDSAPHIGSIGRAIDRTGALQTTAIVARASDCSRPRDRPRKARRKAAGRA